MTAVAEHVPSLMIFDEARGVVAPPARITAWMLLAKAGDEFVYATRIRLPADSKGAAEMRALSARGLVVLFQRRQQGGLSNYVARRTAKPLEVGAEPCSVPAAADAIAGDVLDDEARVIDALLPILARAARFGRPCPTDAQLATRAQIDRAAVAVGLDALERYGTIRVQRAPAPTLRMIIIVATGHKTGLVR